MITEDPLKNNKISDNKNFFKYKYRVLFSKMIVATIKNNSKTALGNISHKTIIKIEIKI